MTSKTIGNKFVKLQTTDNMPKFRSRLAGAMAVAGTAGMNQTEKELLSIFHTRRGWLPNRPSTIARKGNSQPMLDEGFLINALETRMKSIGAVEYSGKVGWFDTPHPDFKGSVADLAAMHDGLNGDVRGIFFQGANGSLVQHRPWISVVAYSDAVNKRILNVMEQRFLRHLGRGLASNAGDPPAGALKAAGAMLGGG